MLWKFITKIPRSINVIQKEVTNVKLHWQQFKNHCVSNKIAWSTFFGFSSAVVGVFGATSAGGGLSFQLSPKFCPNECSENNLKSMIIALMMTNNLEDEEVTVLRSSVEFVYDKTIGSNRKEWCCTEVKNFMNCSEKYGSFQHERCKNYRKMLKSCLASRKSATDMKPTNPYPGTPPWPLGKYKPTNIHERRKALFKNYCPEETKPPAKESCPICKECQPALPLCDQQESQSQSSLALQQMCDQETQKSLAPICEAALALTCEPAESLAVMNTENSENTAGNAHPSIKGCSSCNCNSTSDKSENGGSGDSISMDILDIMADPSLLENDSDTSQREILNDTELSHNDNCNGDITKDNKDPVMFALDYEEWARQQEEELYRRKNTSY